jgi:probable rRNA maturation factor
MKQLRLRNQQTERRVNTAFLRKVTSSLLETELGVPEYELSINLVSKSRMAALNEQYLGHEGSTDVITFDYSEGYGDASANVLTGEIFISVYDAMKQGREFKRSWQEEITRYIVHGILHVLGYDDLTSEKRRKMKQQENRLVRVLSKNFDLEQVGK